MIEATTTTAEAPKPTTRKKSAVSRRNSTSSDAKATPKARKKPAAPAADPAPQAAPEPVQAVQVVQAVQPEPETLPAAEEAPAGPSPLPVVQARVTAELNKTMAVVQTGSQVRVLVEKENDVTGRDEIDLVSVADMRVWYQNKNAEFSVKNPSTGQMYIKNDSKLNLWLSSPKRREYMGVTFDPTTTDKDVRGQYNLWRGWGVEPSAEGKCDLIQSHILEVWCSSDEDDYNYVIDWMADLVQDPKTKKGVAIVLRSGEGTGKGIIINDVLGRILGAGYVHIAHRKHLVGSFNRILQGAMLVFADEAIWAGDKEGEGALKAIISEETLPVEAKGKDSYMVPFPCRVIFGSNEDWVVPAGPDSRRYFGPTVSDCRKGDREYFKRLADQINNGGVEAFLHFLLEREITADLRKAPVTKTLIDQRLRSADAITRWWFQVLDDQAVVFANPHHDPVDWGEGGAIIERDHLHESYVAWCHTHRVGYPATKQALGQKLAKLFPAITQAEKRLPARAGGVRPWGYALPSVYDARAALEGHFGGPLPWSGGDPAGWDDDE